MGEEKAQFLMLHPPYDDIIKFSDKKKICLIVQQQKNFMICSKSCKNGYDLLEKGRFACLIIGDSYKNSEVQPLGFECMNRMRKLGFILKSTIVKDIQGNERGRVELLTCGVIERWLVVLVFLLTNIFSCSKTIMKSMD